MNKGSQSHVSAEEYDELFQKWQQLAFQDTALNQEIAAIFNPQADVMQKQNTECMLRLAGRMQQPQPPIRSFLDPMPPLPLPLGLHNYSTAPAPANEPINRSTIRPFNLN